MKTLKKNLIPIFILIILIIGIITTLLIIDNKIKNPNYEPIVNTGYQINEEDIELQGYSKYYISQDKIIYNNTLYYGDSFFDEEKSYQNIDFTETENSIGEIIHKNEVICSHDGSDILAENNCIINYINNEEKLITIKIIDYVFINIFLNFEDYFLYNVNQNITLYDNYNNTFDGTVIDIDYLNLYDNKLKMNIKINTTENYLLDNHQLYFFTKSIETIDAKVISVSETNNNILTNNVYCNINNIYDGVIIKDGKIKIVSIELGIAYLGNIEVVGIYENNNPISLEGIDYIYAKFN